MATGQPGAHTGETTHGIEDAAEAGVLGRRFTRQRVAETLLPWGTWRPFPRTGDREGWDGLPAAQREALISAAKQQQGRAWEEMPATLFLQFRREGNRTRYEQRHFARRRALADLVLAECAAADGTFLDDIVNGVWALCEESFWGVPAHSARHSPRFPGSGLPDTSFHEVDLFAAETGALLAWTHYLVGDRLARELPVVTARIEREVQARILEPYRRVDDWRWLGKVHRPVNNWNPWIHSNVLACTLLLDRVPAVRHATVSRAVQWLDIFLAGYHTDGGCDEGPGYWGRAGASLFDCLEWLHSASNGQLDAYDEPLVREIGRFIYRVHIDGLWYVNYADASARVALEGELAYRYGRRIGDAALMAQGAFAARHSGEPWGRASIARTLPALFSTGLPASGDAPRPPLVKHAWLDGIQVLAAREREGSAAGLFLSAKGGHNGESHNHNDVGSFIVALDGHPVLIDVGVETYRRETFSDRRYDIWTMQSSYHNVPVINGAEQVPGRDASARSVAALLDDQQAQLQLDIADAYAPEAGVERWIRTVRLERGAGARPARVVLEDEWRLREVAEPRALALHLMASGPVDCATDGVLRCAAPTRPLRVTYDAAALMARVEEIKIDDARLSPVWGERVYRVVLEARRLEARGRWRLEMM